MTRLRRIIAGRFMPLLLVAAMLLSASGAGLVAHAVFAHDGHLHDGHHVEHAHQHDHHDERDAPADPESADDCALCHLLLHRTADVPLGVTAGFALLPAPEQVASADHDVPSATSLDCVRPRGPPAHL